MQGWDLNSSSRTVTTPRLLSRRWWKFWCMAPVIHTNIERVQNDSAISQHLSPTTLFSLVYWKVRHGWDWYMGTETVTTTYFPALRGYKFGLAHHTYFSNPGCVCTDWFMQFTASQPFQCVIISIMNGWRRWRLEFILQNRPHTPAFESPVMKISVPGPYISYQPWACAEWFSHFTASQPFQSLFISMMNG